ncbi:Glu-tRNA(Gln) amidotransferase subunit GatE [bacterium]|nr:Glu-tRNA(Gln) amidotransferase subunit GatE [bacterium]
MADPVNNYRQTQVDIGYIPRTEATPDTYKDLGFKSGLEIHQQIKTDKKLFCRCPAGKFQNEDDYNAELIRHMRPTLSELGEYDGTALMEFRTRKNIHYLIKDETACTYDFDDTPPFKINRQALNIAMRISLLLKQSLVGELHITRKQYLDGSIPTGFQRTAIVGINGQFQITNKTINLIQMSIEEDSCREVSDIGHERYYTTDRLGMPLIEIVTHPEMLTPDEVAEAGQYLRFVTRSTGQVQTGMGAGRQDVNVSITGGTRVEIKGVAHIKWIPELVHVEAFRQKALLTIKDVLIDRIGSADKWEPQIFDISDDIITPSLADQVEKGNRVIAMVLPGFEHLLSHFTQPGRIFTDELSDRLKVIACLEKPNLSTSEDLEPRLDAIDRAMLDAKSGNMPWITFWGPEADMETAKTTIDERCRLAFEGVPNETRKSLPDGTTLFERVLPGPDRMYPDTDSAPIPISDEEIKAIGTGLPEDICDRMAQMDKWDVPRDCFPYLLSRSNRYPMLSELIDTFDLKPKTIATLMAHVVKHAEGRYYPATLADDTLANLFAYVYDNKIDPALLKVLLPLAVEHGDKDVDALIRLSKYRSIPIEEILAKIPQLQEAFAQNHTSPREDAVIDYIMGEIRPFALGNIDLKTLRVAVEGDRS